MSSYIFEWQHQLNNEWSAHIMSYIWISYIWLLQAHMRMARVFCIEGFSKEPTNLRLNKLWSGECMSLAGEKENSQPLCVFFSMKCALIGCIELLTVSVKSLSFQMQILRNQSGSQHMDFKTKAFFTVGSHNCSLGTLYIYTDNGYNSSNCLLKLMEGLSIEKGMWKRIHVCIWFSSFLHSIPD